jgi:hypothetical protein
MPIRMEEDEQEKRDDNFPENNPGRRENNSGGGGLGGLTAFLPLILGTLFKKPKLLILLLVLGGLYYFMTSGGGCSSATITDGSNTDGDIPGNLKGFNTGMEMKQEIYDKAEVYEALSDNASEPLPESYSLLQYAPQRLNQGTQGSCVGWASAYAARTILYARQNNLNPDQVCFSPSSLYNQIALTNCQGAYMNEAMATMHQKGILPFREFGYDESDCSSVPGQNLQQRASNFKIKGYNRLSKGGDDYKTNILSLKQNIAAGAPVVIGMMVGGSFMQAMQGRKVWIPSQDDYYMQGFGGHAMCAIGYDDFLEGGAFQIMNSWGKEWGENGVAWVRYKDFEFFNKEAWGLYPMGSGAQFDPNKLAVKFALVGNASKKVIPLMQSGNQIYRTQSPIKIGDKFKVAITNTVECYTYIFGEETDKSSYILFPYTPKHSPYCGVTGMRVFPRDYSMVADNKGTKDYIAFVISKKPINYNELNKSINAASGSTYPEKVKTALAAEAIQNVTFSNEENAIKLDATLNGKNATYVVIEIEKK